jgi:hypothetical protein
MKNVEEQMGWGSSEDSGCACSVSPWKDAGRRGSEQLGPGVGQDWW